MSHDWVYVRVPVNDVDRARIDGAYALRLADGAHRADGCGCFYIPHQVGYEIWWVLCPEKLRRDPHGNDPGDELVGQIMVGYHVVNDEIDTGYGRPRYLEPARVRQAAALLHGVPMEAFACKASAIAASGRVGELRDMLDVHYGRLRGFYFEAAKRQQAIIVTPL